MTNKKRKAARDLSEKTGMKYQAALNALESESGEIPKSVSAKFFGTEGVNIFKRVPGSHTHLMSLLDAVYQQRLQHPTVSAVLSCDDPRQYCIGWCVILDHEDTSAEATISIPDLKADQDTPQEIRDLCRTSAGRARIGSLLTRGIDPKIYPELQEVKDFLKTSIQGIAYPEDVVLGTDCSPIMTEDQARELLLPIEDDLSTEKDKYMHGSCEEPITVEDMMRTPLSKESLLRLRNELLLACPDKVFSHMTSLLESAPSLSEGQLDSMKELYDYLQVRGEFLRERTLAHEKFRAAFELWINTHSSATSSERGWLQRRQEPGRDSYYAGNVRKRENALRAVEQALTDYWATTHLPGNLTSTYIEAHYSTDKGITVKFK